MEEIGERVRGRWVGNTFPLILTQLWAQRRTCFQLLVWQTPLNQSKPTHHY
jgi:hypothetical protein